MAVRIRLTRLGAVNWRSFRVVATDARRQRDGRHLETLGWYDPKRPGRNFELKLDRMEYWLRQGAQLSETVKSLLRRAKREAS